jgi:ABC-type microcin C transport system permease subunit YejB
MLRYLVFRVASIVPVLLGVSVVVFLMMKLVPGDPAEAILGPAATTEKIEMVRRSLGLDQPFYIQYFRWLWKVVQGDFGSSIAVNVRSPSSSGRSSGTRCFSRRAAWSCAWSWASGSASCRGPASTPGSTGWG